MKILVYGAGVIGSIYAAKLKESGSTITLLARGKKSSELKKKGIILEEAFSKKRTVTRVAVVDSLIPQDTYDVIIVAVRGNQLESVLPDIIKNNYAKQIIFLLSLPQGIDAIAKKVGKKRVVIGFPGVGGWRKNEAIMYSISPKFVQPTTFGTVDGTRSSDLTSIIEVFKEAGFPVAINSNMDAWLKTHIAWIIPLEAALYITNCNNYALSKQRKNVALMIDAVREGFKVLSTLNIPLTPSFITYFFGMTPKPLLVVLMQLWFNSKKCEVFMVGHAKAAPDEAKYLADTFKKLALKAQINTPSLDKLYSFIPD
jgi:2-dehydropantoate 2-reductase